MSDIYLVDDHVLMRDGLRAVLEDAGHRVLGDSADPTAALAAVQALQPDVLLLDLNLGERSGFELLELLQQRDTRVRCIVLTMSSRPRDVGEALRLGAAGYVLKGAPARDVLGAIRAVLAGQRHLGAGVEALEARADAADGRSTLYDLSARERQVALGVVRGATSTEIGSQLHLSPKTVDSYRARLMAKLGVADVTGLVRLAVREAWIDVER
jgi:two-component system, NarL family, invasion response regulator UvrY